MEITDVQGNAFLVEHEPVEMKQWGVALTTGKTELWNMLPRETTRSTSISPQGDSTKSMTVELEFYKPLVVHGLLILITRWLHPEFRW
ncbi:MAG: hypothetical protein Ct9H90mP14_2950 [Methanobacteriota archaeon]|nr:MAG: hypothetical protein Ct9H90mP14_2950 [Euryarchaeota archaeon]